VARYEDQVVPDNYQGEWGGAAVCVPCYWRGECTPSGLAKKLEINHTFWRMWPEVRKEKDLQRDRKKLMTEDQIVAMIMTIVEKVKDSSSPLPEGVRNMYRHYLEVQERTRKKN
jgi:hypothetical protein